MKSLLQRVAPINLLFYATHVLASGTPIHVKSVHTYNTPVGTWKQVDDHSGKVTSILKITKKHDKLEAKVIKVVYLTPKQIARDGKNPRCTQCKDVRHNKPIQGMTVMWGVSKKSSTVWSGGHILDPNNGSTYRVKLTLKDHGQKLDVRGYIGFPLLGRTQTWTRKP